MSVEQWSLLRQVAEIAKHASEIPSGFYSALATRLEEMLAEGSRERLLALNEQLSSLFKGYLKEADPRIVEAIRGTGGMDSDAAIAYALGQLSFAQMIAGQAGNRRVDERFAEVVKENADLVNALADGDKTGVELAAATGLRVETVSRKLKLLREIGALDFHREGTSLINFLTPAAKAIAATMQGVVPSHDRRSGAVVRRTLASRQGKLASHMQQPMTFAPQATEHNDDRRTGFRR
ncbi:helix-turn-helix domain-containing protein [Ensifer adhaerens]|uniref:ArsR/SmtB family transcription factor n=1 Tax=Ensifer adhaerens TaxID=106592 RepID=UPI001CBCCF8D|nr:helix-turn-helix domain-containing protein [Ensifer adhaerens]MBZ7925045.1 helix-turn-helix domain-containing protein [Ensifer adhaerens]UAX95761.1 helix-turn-helix domain-containing protein [Ensifer adhaerens]UAY04898.1 helix-turn-helix domain-containing protein [Ensifer adhaerens]UAY10330.1 helix-turn-helix domain-containing protein [Ensifer adhaerens]